MSTTSELEKKILQLELKIFNLRIISLEQKIKELQTKIDDLESEKRGSSFKTAAYNPKGLTEARGIRTNTDSNNTR